MKSELKNMNKENLNLDDVIETAESEREIEIRINKQNSNTLLHYRNIYVFLASVAEDAIKNTQLPSSCLCSFFLVKKLIILADSLTK